MCGIAGAYNFKRANIDHQGFFNWALHSMKHRGPDSNGYWTNESNYHTAFVRLSIRDLSHHGDQPMHSADGRYVIVFNGEIYNTDAFKPALEKDGVRFTSTSDTEVLLYALIKWNTEVLQKLNGIFAFAFYDKHTNELILARDRVGIKPLYIGFSGEGIVYSSQYDHIINHPFCNKNGIDANAINLYMQFGYVPDGAGMVEQTQLLPHGHYLKVTANGHSLHAYYSYPVAAATRHESADSILQQCVTQQLVSDVSLGTFMSGGTDSTLVTYEASKQGRVTSFTIGVDDEKIDESRDAEAFARYFNTEQFTRHIGEADLLNYIQKNTAAFSEPFADYSSIPTLILSEFARTKVTVALSGDGGDELFWGYPRNKTVLSHAKILSKSRPQRYIGFLKERLLQQKKTISTRHLAATNIIDYYYQSLFIPGASVYAGDLMSNPATQDPFFMQQALATGIDLSADEAVMNITRKMEVDLHLQRILIKVDRASMFNSLEVRVPLLDNDMLDYSAGISYKDCIVDGTGKANLKQLLASVTSKELVYKPKKGFVIPMHDWINKQLYKDVQEKLMNMPSHLAPAFRQKEIEKLLHLNKSDTADTSWILWAMYTLVLWDDHHRNTYKKYHP